MVKRRDDTSERIKKIEQIGKLEGIARKVFEGFDILSSDIGAIFIKPGEGQRKTCVEVSLLSGYNITVRNPDLYDLAVRLAQEYENSGEPEFTLVTDYSAQWL